MSYTTTNGGASPVSAIVQSSFAATATFRSSLLIVELPRRLSTPPNPRHSRGDSYLQLFYSGFRPADQDPHPVESLGNSRPPSCTFSLSQSPCGEGEAVAPVQSLPFASSGVVQPLQNFIIPLGFSIG